MYGNKSLSKSYFLPHTNFNFNFTTISCRMEKNSWNTSINFVLISFSRCRILWQRYKTHKENCHYDGILHTEGTSESIARPLHSHLLEDKVSFIHRIVNSWRTSNWIVFVMTLKFDGVHKHLKDKRYKEIKTLFYRNPIPTILDQYFRVNHVKTTKIIYSGNRKVKTN